MSYSSIDVFPRFILFFCDGADGVIDFLLSKKVVIGVVVEVFVDLCQGAQLFGRYVVKNRLLCFIGQGGKMILSVLITAKSGRGAKHQPYGH